MNLSKDFYNHLISLVNEGYKAVRTDSLLEHSNILVFSIGDIKKSSCYIDDLLRCKDAQTAVSIISQPYRIDNMRSIFQGKDEIYIDWKGRYTMSVLDVLSDKTKYDAVLYFGSTPVAESNSNILEIADAVIDSPSGKGCFIYSFVEDILYEYKNIHSFYSAIQVNKHINMLLETDWPT